MKYKPLFGIITHNQALFIINYYKQKNQSNISKQGYSIDIFKDEDIPVIRFDLTSFENVMESIKGNFESFIEELYFIPENIKDKSISLDEYLEKLKNLGIPIHNSKDLINK